MSQALATWTTVGLAACGCRLESIASGVVTALKRCALHQGRDVVYTLTEGAILPLCDSCHRDGAHQLVAMGSRSDAVCEECRSMESVA